PEGRGDAQAQGGAVGAPDAVVVRGPHPEGVVARGEVRVRGLVLAADVAPVAIEALELVRVLILLGEPEVEGGEAEGDDRSAMGEREVREQGDARRERRALDAGAQRPVQDLD